VIRILLPENRLPSFYAAAEEWMIRNLPKADYVFLYTNSPCVIVGKNQSVWKEINWDFIQQHPEKIMRRVSGGGTVYHDNGNLNFGFIKPFEESLVNNYKAFNKPIVAALHRLGINATFSDRNDLLLDGYKISGNAQFTDRKMILSHGTLLFDADMETLRFALKKNDFKVESKAVSSVRSKVLNLSEKLPYKMTAFVENILPGLPIEKNMDLDKNQVEAIELLVTEKYQSFDWIFGHSPITTFEKNDLKITIEKGLIKDVQIRDENSIVHKLIGQPFVAHDIKKTLMHSMSVIEVEAFMAKLF
jgi:lipoate-protein ligase A